MKPINCIVRTSAILVSATLVGIAAELPMPASKVAITKCFPVGMSPSSFQGFLSIADVNGDGLDDVISPKAVYLQDANGDFTINAASQLNYASRDCLVAIPDVTGDGIPDFLVQSELLDGQSNPIGTKVELQTGVGETGRPSGIALAAITNTSTFSGLYPVKPQVVDLNGDGFKDVAFVFFTDNNGQGIHAFMANGSGFAGSPTTIIAYAGIASLGVNTRQGVTRLVVAAQAPVPRYDEVTLDSQLKAVFNPADTSGRQITQIAHLSNGSPEAADSGVSLLAQVGGETNGSALLYEQSSIAQADVGGSFWLVPDLTGDGLDDLVARPVGTTSDIVSGVVPTLPSLAPTSFPIARPFAEGAGTDLAGVFPNARYFPYAVNSGSDAQGRTLPNRLLMAPNVGGDVLGYDSLAPQITVMQGGPGNYKSLAYSIAGSPVPVFDAGDLTLDFGDAESQISRLTVILTSGTSDDTLSFDVSGTSIVVQPPTISAGAKGSGPTRTYTFTTPATVDDYRTVLRSIVYNSSGSPSPLEVSIVVSLSARDRATAEGDGYALAPYQIASLGFAGTPIFSIPLLTDASGFATFPFSQGDGGTQTDNFTLSVITQGSQGLGTIDQSGQVFSYQANPDASGSDEVILSVVDDVDIGDGVIKPQVIGQVRMQITIQASVPTLDVSVIAGNSTFVLGESLLIQVAGGIGPYRIRADHPTTMIPVNLQQRLDGARAQVEAPSTQGFYLKPLTEGVTVVTVTDAKGTSATIIMTTSQLPSVEVPRPSVAVSVGGQTVFGPICPGTPQGVTSLVNGLKKVDSRQGRGFTWDAPNQHYVELPAVPSDGIGPTTGVFLAVRIDLGLDFSGAPLPLGSEIILQQDWNFVGIGPVDDGSVPLTSHSLATDFDLIQLSDQSVQSKDQIGNVAYFWNGTGYETTTVLQSNVGYWIKNLRSDGEILSLKRVATGTGTSPALRSAPVALKTMGQPPTPPASSSANKDDGGCGTGSGLAAMFGGLLLALRLRFRR